MQKEINHLEEQINKTNTDTAREELITRYYTNAGNNQTDGCQQKQNHECCY